MPDPSSSTLWKRCRGKPGRGMEAILSPMPFHTGTVSWARYRVVGAAPESIDQDVLDALAGEVIRPSAVGAPPEVEAGWSAGRHVFDEDFSPEVVAYGERLLIGMRLDTNRVPAEIRRAYRAMAEAHYLSERSAGSETGHLSRTERLAAKEDAEERARVELAEGRYRRSKLIPIAWDLPSRTLLAPTFSDATQSALTDLFRRTFEGSLRPLSSGSIAHEVLAEQGRSRDHDDAEPTRLTPAPALARAEEGDRRTDAPAVPWAYGGPEPKDFLGNEFLIWLWSRVASGQDLLETSSGTVAIALDTSLDMDCAWEATGKQSLRADGPTRLPEALVALRNGKWPRKMGMHVAAGGEAYELSLQGDRFLLTGVKLPRPDEDEKPASVREATDRRLEQTFGLDGAMVEMYGAFLRLRFGGGWAAERERLVRWLRGGERASHTAGDAIAAPGPALAAAVPA